MPDNILRIFIPAAPKEDRVQKRRAQIRKAQETYCNRKEQYVKDLERNVAESRACELKLLQENEQLGATIHSLLGLLQQHGTQIPADLALPPPPTPYSTTSAYSSPSECSGATMINTIASPPSGRRVCVADVDHTELGVEFVLTLERPCLGHLHGDPDNPQSPAGHALTLSSQVCAASDPNAITSSRPVQRADPQLLPASMLENLLQLSKILQPSDQEVTPVQAWHFIRSQQHFGSLDIHSLQTLARILGNTIKCHGFGAVIDRNVFERLAYDILLGLKF